MKKYGLVFFIFLQSINTTAQQTLPSYYTVLKHFFSKYTIEENHESFTNFAKKRTGWFVQQINRNKTDTILSEKIFWSLVDEQYYDLSDSYSVALDSLNFESKLEPYLDYGWYNYDHIRYYGYKEWQFDMIDDFSNTANLSDTMLDGLGRAYDNMAYTYLWSQGGYHSIKDSMQIPLKRLQLPSAARIEKVKFNLNNAIMQFIKLNTLKPGYKTVIGNATLKLFNEYMHGYNQMIMCGSELLATKYLAKASLPDPYIIQAKNYLNSCDQNAILFSYGDNDTYQLWYVQEKFNFRKDVLVINNSLLGLPVYVDMFRRKKTLEISMPDAYLQDPANDVAYFYENRKASDLKKVISLNEFLKTLYSKKYFSPSQENITYPTYPYSTVMLSFSDFKNKSKPNSLNKNISFVTNKNYYFINDIVMLDIICNNISKRPVYFTSNYGISFEKNLSQKGIVYKLTTKDMAMPAEKKMEVKELEKFINEKYAPILSNDSDLISFDGDNVFFGMYYLIFNYYLEKKDTTTFKKWLHKLDSLCPKINSTQINTARHLAYYFIEAGEIDKGLAITNQFTQWLYNAYKNPNSLTGFYSKEKFIGELNKTKNYLLSHNLSSSLIQNLLEN